MNGTCFQIIFYYLPFLRLIVKVWGRYVVSFKRKTCGFYVKKEYKIAKKYGYLLLSKVCKGLKS